MTHSIEVIVPSYKSKMLVSCLIQSMEMHKPKNLTLKYHVVENSYETSYKDDILALSDKIEWYNNPSADTGEDSSNNKGSWANCSAIEFVMDKIQSDYTFLCHNDCIVTSEEFFTDSLLKIEEGNCIVGTSLFPNKVSAIHVAGLFVKTEILKKVGVKPQFDKNMDVGDILTVYCRDENLKTFCFENTINNKQLIDLCDEPWRSLGVKAGLDRALNLKKNKVIYVHLGRGTMKMFGKYYKQGKVYYKDWYDLCSAIISDCSEGS